MKFLSAFTFLLIMALSSNGKSQMVFGVSPGLGLNSAYVGYKINDKLVPYFGLQYLGVKYNYEDEDFQDDFSGSLIIPSLGLKLFLSPNNQLQPYLNVSVSKPLVAGKLEYDGEEDEEFADAVQSINLFGGEAGFGVEYFFDDNFSIGGEYGIRFFSGKYESSDQFDDYAVKLNVNPTYTKLALNFYFGGKSD